MCSTASAILASIVTIFVNFGAIFMYLKACGRWLLWNWLLKFILTENLFKIASKITSIVTILVKLALAGEHIFQVLGQYSWVLPQYLPGAWLNIVCLMFSKHVFPKHDKTSQFSFLFPWNTRSLHSCWIFCICNFQTDFKMQTYKDQW